MATDEKLKQADVPLNGKWITSRDNLLLKEGDFSVLTNMRYTDTNPVSIGGMEIVNSTDATYGTPFASYQFIKNQPDETHNMYQLKTEDSPGMITGSQLVEVTAPAIGAVADLTEVLTLDSDGTTTDIAQFANAPNNAMIYCNGENSYIWPGTRNVVGKVLNATDDAWDTSGFLYDYTERLSTNGATACKLYKDTTKVYVYVMSTHILSGMYFDIAVPGTTATTTKVYFYDCSVPGWHELTTAAPHNLVDGTVTGGTVTMGQDGYITWVAPTTQTPNILNGINGYWYKVEVQLMTGTQIQLQRIYGKYEIQNMHNLWDGQERACLSLIKKDASNDKFYDFTPNVSKVDYQEVGTNAYKHTAMFTAASGVLQFTSSDELYFGFTDRTSGVFLKFAEENTNGTEAVPHWAYWDGNTWTELTGVNDGTASDDGVHTWNKNGLVSWASPSSDLESTTSINNGPDLYYYKFTLTDHGFDALRLDYVTGIPQFGDVDPYKTCTLWKNRVVLGNNLSLDANALKIGVSNTNCVFNGSDSVEMYVDDPQPIHKLGTISSKYASGMFDTLLILKRNQTYILEGTNPEDYKIVKVSDKHGIVSHRTFASAEYNDQNGGYRSCAIWLSTNGVVMYDGGVVRPMDTDIDDVFRNIHNSAYTTRINPAYSYKAVGWYDSLCREYHLLYPEGTSTVNNAEVVFDLERLKWYNIDRGALSITYGAQFVDANGNPIQYGFLDSHFYRLDYGTSFNGTAISSVMRVSDKPFTKSVSQEAVVRYVRLIGKSVAVTTGTPVISLTHYGDGDTTGTSLGNKSAANSGSRLYHNIWQTNKKHNIHGYQFTFTNAYNLHHFEPLIMSILYKGDRIEVRGED